jgi:DNA-binding transcriptional LysR family regulator
MKLTTRNQLQIHSSWVVYFHEIVRCGSIRAAARKLNVAPSAISRRVKDLEAILGVELLEKTSTHLRPTAAGEFVAAHAMHVLRGLDQMRAHLDDLNGLRSGHVKIVAVQAVATEFLPRALARLVERYPRVTFECEVTGSANVMPQLVAGNADIGITFHASSNRQVRQLIGVPLAFGIITAPDHPLASKRVVRLHDLEDQPVILPEKTISFRIVVDRMLEGRSFQFRNTVTASDPNFIAAMVKFGAGIAFQTPVGVEPELREGSLKFIPLQDKNLRPPELIVAIPADRAPSPMASVAAESLRNAAASLLEEFLNVDSET